MINFHVPQLRKGTKRVVLGLDDSMEVLLHSGAEMTTWMEVLILPVFWNRIAGLWRGSRTRSCHTICDFRVCSYPEIASHNLAQHTCGFAKHSGLSAAAQQSEQPATTVNQAPDPPGASARTILPDFASFHSVSSNDERSDSILSGHPWEPPDLQLRGKKSETSIPPLRLPVCGYSLLSPNSASLFFEGLLHRLC